MSQLSYTPQIGDLSPRLAAGLRSMAQEAKDANPAAIFVVVGEDGAAVQHSNVEDLVIAVATSRPSGGWKTPTYEWNPLKGFTVYMEGGRGEALYMAMYAGSAYFYCPHICPDDKTIRLRGGAIGTSTDDRFND